MTIKNIKLWYKNNFYEIIYGIIGIVFWLIFVISFAFHFIGNTSITYFIERKINYEIPVSQLINLVSIKEVVKMIGVTSIFLTWLYSVIDKVEIGVKYIQLINKKYKLFWCYTISHIISALLCVWFSNSEALELSFISFLIVIWGCVMHGVILLNIVLLPSKRQNIALKYWDEYIEISDNCEELLQRINSFVGAITPKDSQFYKTSDLIIISMKKAYNKAISENKNAIVCIFSIWQNVLESFKKSERNIIIRNLLDKIFKDSMSDEIKYHMVASYVLLLYKQNYSVNISDTMQTHVNMADINIEMKDLIYNTDSYIGAILLSYFWYIVWIEFLNNRDSILYSEFFDLNTKIDENIKNKAMALFETYSEPFISALYPTCHYEIVCTAKEQVKSMINSL